MVGWISSRLRNKPCEDTICSIRGISLKWRDLHKFKIYFLIWAISQTWSNSIPEITEWVAGSYNLGVWMQVGDLAVWRSDGLPNERFGRCPASQVSLWRGALTRRHSSLCNVMTLLCHVRDCTTISLQSCAHPWWVQDKVVIAPGRWRRPFSTTPSNVDLMKSGMTWGCEWFAEACHFDCSVGLLSRRLFVFVGHVLLQEKARSNSYGAFNARDNTSFPKGTQCFGFPRSLSLI